MLKTALVAVSAVESEAIWRSRCAGSSLGLKGSSFLFFLDTRQHWTQLKQIIQGR